MSMHEAPVEQPQGEQPVEAPEVVDTPTEPEAQAAEPDKTESEEQQEEPQRDEKGRFKSGVQGRMDELTRARREAEREAAYWRAVAEGRGEQQSAPKPTQDQFETYDGYVEALAEWKADQKIAQTLGRRAEQVVRATQAQTFEERVAQARSTLTDFDQVVGKADVVIADHVKESLLDSERGPELAYHLAKHPQEAYRLSAMSPLAAAREIGRMEAAMGRPSAPAPKTVSTAPPPTRPVSSGRSPTKDLASMSMEEYVAARAKERPSWMR